MLPASSKGAVSRVSVSASGIHIPMTIPPNSSFVNPNKGRLMVTSVNMQDFNSFAFGDVVGNDILFLTADAATNSVGGSVMTLKQNFAETRFLQFVPAGALSDVNFESLTGTIIFTLVNKVGQEVLFTSPWSFNVALFDV